MLIDPQFDESAVRRYFRDDAQDMLRFSCTDTEFVMYCDLGDGDGEMPLCGFEKIETGVYWTDLNPHMVLKALWGDRLVEFGSLEWKPGDKWSDRYTYEYGVADSPEQLLSVKKIRKAFVDSPDQFVLCCTPMRKSEQEERGGWRWHKWGPYVGKQKPQCEYLYDEPKIKEVIVYHFYQLRRD